MFCFGVCFVLLFSNQLQAQEPRRDSGADGQLNIQPLQIGDSIPTALWDFAHTLIQSASGNKTIRLGDYSSKKLIVLDFWATWCTTCLARLPNLHRLAEANSSEMELIPVTYEDADKVARYFGITKNEKLQKLWPHLNSVVGDKLLKAYFPHTALPHLVIIRDGIVVDIPPSILVDSLYLSNIIANPPRADAHDKNVPNGDEKKTFFSKFSGFKQQESSAATRLDTVLQSRHVHYSNYPIAMLYRLTGCFDEVLTTTGLVVADTLFDFDLDFTSASRESTNPQYLDWCQRNLFCYEASVPASYDGQALKLRMKNDLDFFLAVRSFVDKRTVPVYLLKYNGKLETILSNKKQGMLVTDGTVYDRNTRERIKAPLSANGNANYMQRCRIKDVLDLLKQSFPGRAVIDETGITALLDIDLPDDCKDFAAFRDALYRQNFILEEGLRSLDVLVLSPYQSNRY